MTSTPLDPHRACACNTTLQGVTALVRLLNKLRGEEILSQYFESEPVTHLLFELETYWIQSDESRNNI